MVKSRNDIVLSWVPGATRQYYKFRLGEAEAPYIERTQRAEVQQQVLGQSQDIQALKSRIDSAAMHQTSWASGAQWWQPLISGANVAGYYRSNHLDTWSEPGKIVPMNLVDSADLTDELHIHNKGVVGEDGVIYLIGHTANVNASYRDVYAWDPATNDFVQETGYHSGVGNTDSAIALIYDPSDNYIYVYDSDGHIDRFDPDGSAQDASWLTGLTLGGNLLRAPGQAAGMIRQNNTLMVYNGDSLYEIDKSGPTATEIFDDGMGPDFLCQILTTVTTGPIQPYNNDMIISTPQGVYYTKNVVTGGQPQAWVFRVEKDASGSWIGNPIATLPIGTLALDMAYHLGQVVISTTPDWGEAVANTNDLEVVYYFVGEGGIGALGSPLGARDQVDETPWSIIGSRGPLLYFAGKKRLWVYDAIRGGLHTAFEFPTTTTKGPYLNMFYTVDSDDDQIMLFIAQKDQDEITVARTKTEQTNDPDTVTNFGDDESHYYLESNWFDGGLPFETKRLNKVEIFYDPQDDDNQEWTVQVLTDDGSFADAINESTAKDNTLGYAQGWAEARGRRFRYRVIYQTKDTDKIALRAILVTFITGTQVREWELVLDASEVRNVDNELVRPEDVLTNIRLVQANDDVISLLDNYTQDRDKDTEDINSGEWVNVKVQSTQIMKSTPGEALIRVVLREDTFYDA